MCGIAGFWGPFKGGRAARERTLGQMCQKLRLRGPDASDTWHQLPAEISLGHQRLSIQDLSEAGLQPMSCASGRYTVVFNGEVYNAGQLREQLDGVAWRGHADTEVLVEAIDAWGLEAAVEKFVGMFAFGLWDHAERCLTLVRDRLGIKPLAWSQGAYGVVFGSTLSAVTCHPKVPRQIDRQAVAEYLRYSCFPGTLSVYASCHKVAPGQMLRFEAPTKPPMPPIPIGASPNVRWRAPLSLGVLQKRRSCRRLRRRCTRP